MGNNEKQRCKKKKRVKIDHYTQLVKEAWLNIAVEKINALIESVPRQLDELKRKRGGSSTHH